LDRKWWTLAAVLIGVFMLLLDVTIVNVALPEIQRDLGSSFSDLQWVIDAYALTLASTLLVSGSVADLIGRRRVSSKARHLLGRGLRRLGEPEDLCQLLVEPSSWSRSPA